MLKARRKEQTEQLKFPEPRFGLPEDPRPFVGAEHMAAAMSIQQQLTARCLVAVIGPLGAGKSTVCLRAANSRWARQWFLQDENGQPVHRRFWADLEDCQPGPETRQKIARAVGCPTFEEAYARLGSGKPCLLILDNADVALAPGGDGDGGDTLADIEACVARGASVVVTRRQVDDLRPERPWSDVIEVSEFAIHDEARLLFDQLAPRHMTDFRVDRIVEACDRLPLAVHLLARVAAAADLEAARIRIGSGSGGPTGLDFALLVSTVTLDPEDRVVWAAFSHFPSGLSSDDITAVVAKVGDASERAIRLFEVGVMQRCEAGIRIPVALRLPGSVAGLGSADIANLWRNYVGRGRAVVEPAARAAASVATAAATDGSTRSHRRDRSETAVGVGRTEAQVADRWLSAQIANLSRLSSRSSLPPGTVELAGAGLVVHASGLSPDLLDRVLVRLAIDAMGDTIPESLSQAAATIEDQRRFGTSALLATGLVEGHRRVGVAGAEAGDLCQLGRAERFRGHFDVAYAHLRDAQAGYRQLGDAVGEGRALFEMGQIDLERGNLDGAEDHLGAALGLFAAHGRPVGEANVNLDLVRVDLARGRLDSAERRLKDALDRYQQADHQLGSANACLQLGQIELARGQLDDAGRQFRLALDSYEQVGDKVGFANACLQLGQVDLARGRLDNAERRFGAALVGYDRVGDSVGKANASLQLGQIDLARGRLASASTRLSQALTAYRELGDQIGLANSSLQLGQVHIAQGELAEAEELLWSAQSIYDEIGDRLGSANSRQLEAILLQAQRRPSAAMSMYGEASRVYASLGRTASAGWSLAGAARVCTGRAERRGYAADAVRLLEQAGMGDAAAKVAAEFAEPAPEPEPEPAPVAVAAVDVEPAADASASESLPLESSAAEPLAPGPAVAEPAAAGAAVAELVAEAADEAPSVAVESESLPTLPNPALPSADWDKALWGPFDPHELIQVAHGDIAFGTAEQPDVGDLTASREPPVAEAAEAEPPDPEPPDRKSPDPEPPESPESPDPEPPDRKPPDRKPPDRKPPEPEPEDSESRRKPRFRLGRKKDRAPDPPTLPGL